MSPPDRGHQLPRDGQAQAGPAVGAGGRRVGLAERLEQAVHLVLADADTCVDDVDAEQHSGRPVLGHVGPHPDLTDTGELDRVGDEVGEHLAESGGVADQAFGHVVLDADREPDPPLPGGLGEPARRRAEGAVPAGRSPIGHDPSAPVRRRRLPPRGAGRCRPRRAGAAPRRRHRPGAARVAGTRPRASTCSRGGDEISYVAPGDVLFDTDQATIRPEAAAALGVIAAAIPTVRRRTRRSGSRATPTTVGTDEHNLDLSQRRAAGRRRLAGDRTPGSTGSDWWWSAAASRRRPRRTTATPTVS